MADDHDIYKKCERCDGTGTVSIDGEPYDGGPPSETTCPRCNGSREYFWGRSEEHDED